MLFGISKHIVVLIRIDQCVGADCIQLSLFSIGLSLLDVVVEILETNFFAAVHGGIDIPNVVADQVFLVFHAVCQYDLAMKLGCLMLAAKLFHLPDDFPRALHGKELGRLYAVDNQLQFCDIKVSGVQSVGEIAAGGFLNIHLETIIVKGELRLFESMPYSLVLGLLHCSRRCKNLKMVEYHFISNIRLLNRQDNQCNVGSGLCPASLRWNRTVCLSQIGAGTQAKFRRMIADAKVGKSKHWRLNSYNRIMLNAVSNPLNSETIRDFERLLIASELIFLWFFHF